MWNGAWMQAVSRWVVGVVPVACLLLWAGGCSRHETDRGILAQVGPVSITHAEFEAELKYRRWANLPVSTKEALLDDMIERKIMVLRAQALGLHQDPELRRSYESLLIGKLKEHELSAQSKVVPVSDEEVKARYERDAQKYRHPGKVRLALLYLKRDALMKADQINELKSRLEEVRVKAQTLPAGTLGFGALAVAATEDQASRYRGGDQGWFNIGQPSRWPQAVMEAGYALKKHGDISEVIQTDQGFFLVLKTDSRPPDVTPLAEVKETIRRRLVLEQQRQTEQKFLADVRTNYVVRKFPEALATLPFNVVQSANPESAKPPALP